MSDRMDRPIVNSHATASNPFGSLVHSSSYIYVILLNICNISVHFFTISPLSFRAENNLDHSIPATDPNASIGIGGSTPPYTPFSFGGSQILK
jgi:hypothetical protein